MQFGQRMTSANRLQVCRYLKHQMITLAVLPIDAHQLRFNLVVNFIWQIRICYHVAIAKSPYVASRRCNFPNELRYFVLGHLPHC